MLDITFGYVLRSSMMTGKLNGVLGELPHRLDSVAQTPPTANLISSNKHT
jgi:hypothetical protein